MQAGRPSCRHARGSPSGIRALDILGAVSLEAKRLLESQKNGTQCAPFKSQALGYESITSVPLIAVQDAKAAVVDRLGRSHFQSLLEFYQLELAVQFHCFFHRHCSSSVHVKPFGMNIRLS